MNQIELANGISLLYSEDCEGRVVLRFPDGTQVQTTWTQLSHIETLINSLRQAYEILLKNADSDAKMPVDELMRIDDLLYALRRSGRSAPARHTTN